MPTSDPDPGHLERRTARSRDPLVALSSLLESIRTRSNLDALAVADQAGLVVAGAGAWRACEEMAAFGAVLADRVANEAIPRRGDVLIRETEIRRIRMDGIEVLLCGRGGGQGRETGLAEAAAGCERILGRRKR